MSKTQNCSSTEEAEKYGISVSCRIPATLHRQIGDEAAIRKISLASQLSSIIQIGSQRGEERNAEVTILLREKGNLQVEVASLKKELEIREQKLSVQTEDEAYFSQLRLNRDILKKYLSSSPLFLEKLEQEGFNLSFATHIGMLYEKQYFCILEMGYRQKKNLIYIKQL
jgi:hypothetical protein